jgi:hypothetical protein
MILFHIHMLVLSFILPITHTHTHSTKDQRKMYTVQPCVFEMLTMNINDRVKVLHTGVRTFEAVPDRKKGMRESVCKCVGACVRLCVFCISIMNAFCVCRHAWYTGENAKYYRMCTEGIATIAPYCTQQVVDIPEAVAKKGLVGKVGSVCECIWICFSVGSRMCIFMCMCTFASHIYSPPALSSTRWRTRRSLPPCARRRAALCSCACAGRVPQKSLDRLTSPSISLVCCVCMHVHGYV